MQDTLGVDLLWEGQSYKPGYHGNKGRTLTWLNDEVVLRTWVSVTSMSMNITSFKCGDIVCASSWMLWIRCIQRSQVLLVICSAACVNHLLFAEQSHRWRLKWQDFDWLAGWLCVCVCASLTGMWEKLQPLIVFYVKVFSCSINMVTLTLHKTWLRMTRFRRIWEWAWHPQLHLKCGRMSETLVISVLFKNRIVLYTSRLILSTELLIKMFLVEDFFSICQC